MGALSFNWNFKNSFQYLLDPTVTCHFSIPLTFRETGLGSPALHYVSYLSWPQPFFSSLHTSSLSELFWCKIYTLGVSTKHLTSQCHVSLVFFLKVFDLHCTVNSILLVFCWQLALKLAFPFHCYLAPDTQILRTHSLDLPKVQIWAPTGILLLQLPHEAAQMLLHSFSVFGNLVNKVLSISALIDV